MLSVSAANTLLSMESEKTGRTVSTTEVLVIPASATSGFDENKLAKALYDQGWNISINKDDKKYAWLHKGNQYVLMYFSSDPKEISLFFALGDSNPQKPQTSSASANKENSQGQKPIESSGQNKPTPTQQSAVNGFAFTTTNFDDGWVATVKDDWVQVTKGAVIVLVHYPNKQADAYNSVLMDGLKNAWNILVAPKYSSGSNFEFKPVSNWEPIEFAEADMVEKSTGRRVHVVLFKKNYSNGMGKYLEFITPDKATFENEFGAYHEGPSGWERIENMASYNKFAVAAADLSGKWTSDFSGAIQYVNAYTGLDAGMATHASNENFHIGPGTSYQWDLGVASGTVGNVKFQSVKSSGNFSMAGNWQITFSDIEGKPRTYNTYFSCIKGLRILWLDDRPFAKSQ